jgi:hypothetical protein
MFAFDVFTHEQTLDMMKATRSFCDDDEEIRCWLTGIPYDYWTQYLNIFDVLLELSGYAVLAGFGISFIFLFAKLAFEARYPIKKVFAGSLIGAVLIACTMLLTLTTVCLLVVAGMLICGKLGAFILTLSSFFYQVIGFSLHAGVNLTGFSNMSFVLSIGFTVEYSVHIIARWMRASMNHKTSLDRVGFTMEFLMLVSSSLCWFGTTLVHRLSPYWCPIMTYPTADFYVVRLFHDRDHLLGLH